MAQGQQITPETLPGGFSQWDSTPSASPSSAPDVLPSDFNKFDAPPDQPQGNPIMRFLKAGASRYLGATLNAGPTTSTPATYGTPEWQRAEQEMYQRYQKGQAQPGLADFLKSASLSNVPANALNEVKNLNPIDVQKFQNGDVAGGLGSSLMNLLLIRSGFKQMRSGAPEFGSPNAYAEQVQPLSGYTKVQTQQQLPNITPGSSVTLPPSTSNLPNATYLRPDTRAIINPKNAPPSTAINKNVNTNVQDYFIQKMRDQINRQTVTGSAEQDAAIQRMNEYAKSPFDRATASGPVESPQFAYRTRDAGETGIMPLSGKAQASLDPATVQSYMEGRATAQNHPQELVRIDLSKLDPSEYSVEPNGYVKFKGAVPESFIEKMGSKAMSDTTPRVPTSDADMQNLLMQSLQMVKARAGRK